MFGTGMRIGNSDGEEAGGGMEGWDGMGGRLL